MLIVTVCRTNPDAKKYLLLLLRSGYRYTYLAKYVCIEYCAKETIKRFHSNHNISQRHGKEQIPTSIPKYINVGHCYII